MKPVTVIFFPKPTYTDGWCFYCQEPVKHDTRAQCAPVCDNCQKER